jgi:hypothetical protein
MSNEIDPVPSRQVPPEQVPPKRINWRPIGLTLLASIVLGAGSCFGAIISGGKTLSFVFSALFIACVVAFVGGLLWALGIWIERITRGE